jgi:nucleotide-binding universal stress UspA family protein
MNDDNAHRVLLPIDGSAHAHRAAEYLAGCTGSLGIGAIYVLNVQSVEEQAALIADGASAPDYEERGRQATASARGVLDAARLPNSSITLLGDPAMVIVRVAEEEQVDEIVMASRSQGHLGDVIGSVAYKVIHRAHIPVTIVPASSRDSQHLPPPDSVHRILLAVDGSEPAAHAVHFVCGLRSPSTPIEVQLLNVPLPIPAGYVRGLLSEDMIDSYHREEREQALNAASAALEAAGLKFTVHMVPGQAAEKIVEIASRLRCARVVMGTRGLNAVAGIALGSVAYKVIHLSSIPVTLVK